MAEYDEEQAQCGPRQDPDQSINTSPQSPPSNSDGDKLLLAGMDSGAMALGGGSRVGSDLFARQYDGFTNPNFQLKEPKPDLATVMRGNPGLETSQLTLDPSLVPPNLIPKGHLSMQPVEDNSPFGKVKKLWNEGVDEQKRQGEPGPPAPLNDEPANRRTQMLERDAKGTWKTPPITVLRF